MMQCRACAQEFPDNSRFCPHCGQPATVGVHGSTVIATPRVPPPSEPSSISSSDSIDDARFTPGSMLSERYRIVGLLGKGGMGEIYRADDLKLRHAVAIKFLPQALTKDPKRLERFHHEVRVARHVSHPNVCRVYDIGEADGQPYITMEYVDGEDLASVLRRLGKPTQDKALQIARQLCAGLAAAHDKGVLHRDLKPHNVMIDGQGRVRITDFGLAGFVDEFTGHEVRAGTPAYMAPEQLAGRGVSVKSDIYSLGLILGELFTGKRLFEGASREDFQRSRSSVPTSLSTLSEDIDPAVERVILRCLEPEPASRPSSVLAVAAALPGGDPLAAALAAGETPDPEMVANAGGVGGMNPAAALACALFAIIGAAVVVAIGRPLHDYVPLPKPPAVLADRAAEIIKRVGHNVPVADTAFGFLPYNEYLKHIMETDESPHRWNRLSNVRPPAISFWYRQSSEEMIPPASDDYVRPDSPPLTDPGMALVFLDPVGRLAYLRIVPTDFVESDSQVANPLPPNWSQLFLDAELSVSDFVSAEPEWTPPVYCDERAAWKGHYSDQPDLPVHIEAGAFRGKPVYFQPVFPWTKTHESSSKGPTVSQKIIAAFILSLLCSVVLASILIARRNLRLRRGDRSGANRLALTFLAVTLCGWLLKIDHFAHLGAEFFHLLLQLGLALLLAATIWLFYMALEPYVRRRWPHVLIGWSRVLAGRLRDPLVGRDILIGAVAFSAIGLVVSLRAGVQSMFGIASSTPDFIRYELFLGPRFTLGQLISLESLWFSFFFLFLLFAARTLVRREWLGVLIVVLVGSFPPAVFLREQYSGGPWILAVLLEMILPLILLSVLVRFGFLPIVVATLLGGVTDDLPLTFDFTAWYSGTSILGFLFILAIIAYGFHTALAGRPLFRDELLEG